MAATKGELLVEVVHALPQRGQSVRVSLPAGATVRDALEKSGLSPLARGKVGIFGRVVRTDTPLQPGDRVEIYRPLAAEPTEARRRRAAKRR
jgi:putative ubiquitin-RnfH superfamily antitoxin RatB of RatAB toxin-antitoxin module